jgi:primosomal protein N' (replication factor Y)
MAGEPIARVLVDSPLPQLDRLFDYLIPEHLRGAAGAGVRVRVPLRSAGRVADGLLVEVAPPGDYTGVLSAIESVVSPVRVLTPEVWQLARRAADRAAGSASDIVRLAIPGRQVRVEKAFLAATESEPFPIVSSPPIEGYGPGVIEKAIGANERLAIDAVPLVREVSEGEWVGGWAVTLAAAAASTLASGRSAILAVPDYRDQEQLETALRERAALIRKSRVGLVVAGSKAHLGVGEDVGDGFGGVLPSLLRGGEGHPPPGIDGAGPRRGLGPAASRRVGRERKRSGRRRGGLPRFPGGHA